MEGCLYETGAAVAATKKNLPSAGDRNPKGTPADQLKCPYHHPLYCTVLEHLSCANKRCAMKLKSKEERDAALKMILRKP